MIFIIKIFIVSLLGLLFGFILAIRTYPRREVNKIYRSFKKENNKEGEWVHFREKIDYNFRLIVKPNCETLYSSTFINLCDHNYKLVVPKLSDYFSITFINFQTEVLGYITNKDLNIDQQTEFIISKDKYNCNLCWIIVRYGLTNDNFNEIHDLQNNISLVKLNDEY